MYGQGLSMVLSRVVLMLALLVYQLSHCLVYNDAKVPKADTITCR